MKLTLSITSTLAALALASAVRADVKPNPLFSDHMVLQQSMPLPVWGTADAGEQVTVTLGTAKQTATAAANGTWSVKLPAQKSAGLDAPGMELTIAGKNTLTIKDVLIGEVWIGSGQSNMVFPVSAKGPYGGLTNADAVVAASNIPSIRMFTLADKKAATPQATAASAWQVASPQTVPAFSAVGYLFATGIQKELKVPVGIVLAASGASTAEAWISREALTADPILKPMLDGFDASVAFYKTSPTLPIGQAPPRPTPINKARPAATARQSDPVQDQHEPTVLFNAMISPIVPYAMRGVIWYQGESLCGGDHGVTIYPQVQAALIADWRKRWGQGDFPFNLVELPGQKNLSNNPRIREAQAAVLKLVPNTGMAVIIDTGEATNVHPRNKQPLGDRLTKIALANTYGQKIEFSGPVYDSMKVDGTTIRLKFSHLGAPDHAPALVAKGGALKWFQIAGEDQKFVEAAATIEGDTIIVTSPTVKTPVAVRYAWDNYPDGCNLYNAADIPASPFRTDTWTYPLAGLVE
ncbi:MAG TPA: sialate O-acetylesterase [Phycisphaerae bacterium]|jgi:sialate O-acetylesterase